MIMLPDDRKQTQGRHKKCMMNYRCKQAEILAGVCGQREALERRVYEQDVQLELSLDELETSVQVQQQRQMVLLAINSQVHND